jgi:bacterioferritin
MPEDLACGLIPRGLERTPGRGAAEAGLPMTVGEAGPASVAMTTDDTGGRMRTSDQEALIQQAIEQGPITEAYQAEPRQVVQELNRLRATEITSFLQYKQHAYMAVSMLAPGLKDDFEAHATLELQHADRLATRIQQLGGVPIYNPAEIATKAAEVGVHPEQGPTLTDMVIENLLLERRQVAEYTALIREIGDRDPTTRRLLVDILADTEQHASELGDYLKRQSDTRA